MALRYDWDFADSEFRYLAPFVNAHLGPEIEVSERFGSVPFLCSVKGCGRGMLAAF